MAADHMAQPQECPFFGLKLTGVPRDATENDVRQFFNDCTPIEIVMTDGGIVYVELPDQEAFQKACLKDGHQLRWTKVGVQVLTSKQDYISSVSECPLNEEKGDTAEKDDESQYNVIRLRGLPYSATAADVLGFLKGVNVENGEKSIYFSAGSYGRSTGEVFVEVRSPEDLNVAMKYDREHMGGRYIEIFRSSRAQLEWECRGAEKTGGSGGGVVRLRGLPYGCSSDDIRDFLKGVAICEGGITIQVDDTGRETGEAFIEVGTDRDVEKALDRHKKSIGHRYIEVFRTTHGDIKPVANRWAYGRPSPYPTRGGGRGGRGGRQYGRGRGSNRGYNSSHGNSYNHHYDGGMYGRGGHMGGGPREVPSYPPPTRSSESVGKHSVRMRGLPYSVTVRDIQSFYAPLIPINIIIERDESGRLSGEGEVFFGSHDDAVEAMRKDRSHIGSRYIELFLHSKNDFDRPQSGSNAQHGYGQTNWSNDSSTYTSFSSTDPRAQNRTQQYAQYQQPPTTATVYDSSQQQYGGGVQYVGAQQQQQQQQQLVPGAVTYSQPPTLTQGPTMYQTPTAAAGGAVSVDNSAYGYATQQQQANVTGGSANGGTNNTWY